MAKERKHWVDALRGVCMLAILLYHTEMYYVGKELIDYDLYVTDALYLFFFLSGYLIYKENGNFCFSKKIKGIFRTLLIPYLIFTSIMALPKAFAHGNAVDIYSVAWDVFSGSASWFVATLIIAELLFIGSLYVVRGNIVFMFLICAISCIGSFFYPRQANEFCFWQIDNALLAMGILYLGFVFHRFEKRVDTYEKYILCIAPILLILIKTYVYINGLTMSIGFLDISNNIVFAANILVGCAFFEYLFKFMRKSIYPMEWIGSHSLVYYFLCGGVPLVIGKLFNKIGLTYNGNYLLVVMAFIIVVIVSTPIVAAIYRYIPFVVGKKRGK